MSQRNRRIPLVASDRDERDENIPIDRVLFVGCLEQRHCLIGRAGKVQGDGMNTGMAGIPWGKLMRLPQQRQCGDMVMLAHQQQAGRMSDIGIVRLDLQRAAQQFGTLLIHPPHPIEIGQIRLAGAGAFEHAHAVPSVRLLPLVVLEHVLDLRLHCLAFVLGLHRATTPHTTSSVSPYRDRLFRQSCRLGNTL